MDLELVVLCAIVVIMAATWLVRRGHRTLRIDANGVLIVRSLAKPLYLPWDEIARFGVAYVGKIEEGLYQSGSTRCVGVTLMPSSRLRATKACAENRLLSEYDVLFTPGRGKSVEEFAAYLEGERAKFKKG
jgi:hypothetical protein